MVNQSRRTFIRNIGFCSILMATGNVHKGLSYVTPELFEGHSGIEPVCGYRRICYFGVGETGLNIGNALKHEILNPIPRGTAHFNNNTLTNGPFDIIQFTPNEIQINALLSEYELIFLAGSLSDKHYWIARDLALNTGAYLVITIVPSDPGMNLCASIKPHAKEALIFIDKMDFKPITVNIIRDISSLFTLPTLVCIDLADIKSALAGSTCTGGFVESQLSHSNDVFEKFIVRNKFSIMNSLALCFIISYDYRVDCTLEHMSHIADLAYDDINDNAEIVWSCTNVQRLYTEFRVTFVWVEKRG